MRSLVLFALLISVIFPNSARSENATQLVCDNECQCRQETNTEQYIPLFNIDCSRLELKDSFTQKKIPPFVGRLDLSHNNIEYLIDLTRISSDTLYYIDFSYNKIKMISETYFENLTSLVHINLGYNKIKDLQPRLFHGLKKLQVINLEANQITNLPDKIFDVPSIQELILNDNNLGEFLGTVDLNKCLPKTISRLYIAHVNLTTPNILFRLTDLTKLSIADNPISNPQIILDSNEIYRKYDLEYLDVSGTSLSNFSLLNLFWNQIKILKLNRLPYLKIINANDLILFNNTEELYMDHTQLEKIDDLSFVFERTKPEHFSLKKLSVTYNSALKSVSESLQPLFENINEIHLRGDSWNCDCRLSWLKQLRNIVDTGQMRCASPEFLRNKTVKEIPAEDFVCIETSSVMESVLIILIGILFIVVLVLIALFIYIYFYNLKSFIPKVKYIGPNSPYYSPITITTQKEGIGAI